MAIALCKRVLLTGTVGVALPPERAFQFFTASGEQAWAQGWDPKFPRPVADETEPGTVFETGHGGRWSIWTVVRCNVGELIQYAVVTPGERGGLVSVVFRRSRNGTEVTVSYDLTALDPAANDELERFADNYPSFFGHWEQSIAAAIGGGHLPST
jgi:hypothetical protein